MLVKAVTGNTFCLGVTSQDGWMQNHADRLFWRMKIAEDCFVECAGVCRYCQVSG